MKIIFSNSDKSLIKVHMKCGNTDHSMQHASFTVYMRYMPHLCFKMKELMSVTLLVNELSKRHIVVPDLLDYNWLRRGIKLHKSSFVLRVQVEFG